MASWTAKKFRREKRLRLKGKTRLELVSNYTNEKRSEKAWGGDKEKSCQTHENKSPKQTPKTKTSCIQKENREDENFCGK